MARSRTRPPQYERVTIKVLVLIRRGEKSYDSGAVWTFEGWDADDAADRKLAELEADSASASFFNNETIWLRTYGGGFVRASEVAEIKVRPAFDTVRLVP